MINNLSFKICAKPVAGLFLLTHFSMAYAEQASLVRTKSKLKQLDNQISQLKHTITRAHGKRKQLNNKLAGTEKQLGEGARNLKAIQSAMQEKQKKINELQQKNQQLNSQLITEQQLLAGHIRAAWKMGEYQPVKWVLNQEDPSTVSRMLTFYQYLINSRKESLAKIDTTKKNIALNGKILEKKLADQHTLQNQLTLQQKKLEQNKNNHTKSIQSLDHEIENKQQALSEVERNKKNLSQLLRTLALQSVVRTRQPFMRMRHKLPKPVNVAMQATQKMNQGLTFFAAAGTPVHAVYPGKIVFSDWLNGYGLLLIIDHGKGFMTLYAHNQSLVKYKGSMVLQGERIAAVGHSGGIKQNGLYFEVRQYGKAVPPLDWIA